MCLFKIKITYLIINLLFFNYTNTSSCILFVVFCKPKYKFCIPLVILITPYYFHDSLLHVVLLKVLLFEPFRRG